MNVITNSPIKEAMRIRNLEDAGRKESEIRFDTSNRINSLTYKNKFSGNVCTTLVVVFAILGLFSGGSFSAFIIGGIVGGLIYVGLNILIDGQNKEVDQEKIRIQEDAERSIQNLYDEADRITRGQIDAYDREVSGYSKRIMKNAANIKPMVAHNVEMMNRMISHADAGSNKKFVECDFIYKVEKTGITYQYTSRYTNPLDDFSFDKQRFRNLNTDAECEGLAQVLAKLTIREMMASYPPNSLNITVKHSDAEVTLHYKSANKNFVAARDIF